MRTVALVALLLLTGGLLTWAVAPAHERHCVVAVTRGTEETGYLSVPCDLSKADFFRYLQAHKDDPLEHGDADTVGSSGD